MPSASELPVWGRFDDLVAGTALAFQAPSRVLTAVDAADVVPVLAEVERATARGCWAFGYVAYEAAAGLDPRRAPAPGPEGLPLVQFALCEQPREVPPVAPPPGRARGYAVSPGSGAGRNRPTATTWRGCASTSRPGRPTSST